MTKKLFLRTRQILLTLKVYICKLIFLILKKPTKKKIWLIVERGDDARDNGFVFLNI